MACRQCHELLTPVKEERVGAYEKPFGMQLDEGRESGVDLVLGARLQDTEPYSLRARRLLHVSHLRLGTCVVRVHE